MMRLMDGDELGKSLKTWHRILARIVVGIVLASGLLGHAGQEIALADHIPGATYTGETPTPGPMTWIVSDDGSKITLGQSPQFRLPADCGISDFIALATGPGRSGMAITDHMFSWESQFLSVRGTFPAAQALEVQFVCSGAGGRKTTMVWRGTTTSAPPAGASTDPAPSAQQAAPPAGASVAPFCQADEAPAFQDQLAQLKEQLGDSMGDPAECPHPDAASGDLVQATTTGLAYVRAATSVATFTNGAQRWALTPSGVVTWDGDALDPPPPVAAPAPAPSQPPQTTTSVASAGRTYVGTVQTGAPVSFTLNADGDISGYSLGAAGFALHPRTPNAGCVNLSEIYSKSGGPPIAVDGVTFSFTIPIQSVTGDRLAQVTVTGRFSSDRRRLEGRIEQSPRAECRLPSTYAADLQ
jgi:hypothetical protein